MANLTTLSAIILASTLQISSFEFVGNADGSIDEDGHTTMTLRNGVAMSDLAPFEDGVVSAEIFLVPGRAFTGVIFRAEDHDSGEIFYLRHHQSGNPDAWQYHPRYNGREAYQIYQGEGFGGAQDLPLGRWASLTLTICGSSARATIDGEVVAEMNNLMREPAPGSIGFWALRGERQIRNVKYTPVDLQTCPRRPAASAVPQALAGDDAATPIPHWHVSDAMSRDDARRLIGQPADRRHIVAATHRGIADLNPIAPFTKERDTVIASIAIDADDETIAMLDFGFSDEAEVYLNGDLLFVGVDHFRSRDYRFLGTMGLYDSVPLRLKAGENDLQIIIREVEGGWGVSGQIRDLGTSTIR